MGESHITDAEVAAMIERDQRRMWEEEQRRARERQQATLDEIAYNQRRQRQVYTNTPVYTTPSPVYPNTSATTQAAKTADDARREQITQLAIRAQEVRKAEEAQNLERSALKVWEKDLAAKNNALRAWEEDLTTRDKALRDWNNQLSSWQQDLDDEKTQKAYEKQRAHEAQIRSNFRILALVLFVVVLAVLPGLRGFLLHAFEVIFHTLRGVLKIN
jgi:hypothetical protein